MSQEELIEAFTSGRLSRRSFVRQIVQSGIPKPTALDYADALTAGVLPHFDAAPTGQPGAAMSEKPVQVGSVEVSFAGDGYIIYHTDRERIHSLNHTAALVLELCTGENDASEIAHLLQRCYGLPALPEKEVRQCLAALFKEGLIS